MKHVHGTQPDRGESCLIVPSRAKKVIRCIVHRGRRPELEGAERTRRVGRSALRGIQEVEDGGLRMADG